MNTPKLRESKITTREIDALHAERFITPIVNLFTTGRYKKAQKYWGKVLDENDWAIVTRETLSRWGRPNINMRSLESSPGVWIIDDIKDTVWVIFSDLHHKHPWKGTSIELSIKEDLSDDEFVDTIKRFIAKCKE